MNKIDTCGKRIKARLEELNMSQAELSRTTHINKATLSQYISGKYLPKSKRLDVLAKALNVDVVWLMGYDIEQTEYKELKAHYIENVQVPTFDKEKIAAEKKYLAEILKVYDALNEQGKEKLLDFANDLIASGRYIKNSKERNII